MSTTTYDHGGNVFTVARNLGMSPDDITDFSASINPFGLPPAARESIIGALGSLVHYPDDSHQGLKNALASHHRIAPENIVIANGSTEIIYHLPAMLPGKRALIISPAFSEYAHALVRHNWEIHHFILSAESNFDLDLEKLEPALAEGYDALYLCNPGNPSGALYPLPVIERLYRLCAAAGTFLVLDEAFMDFCEDASAKQIIAGGDGGILLRSMTKFFGMPGLRLGYAVTCKARASALGAMGGPWNVNTLALLAGEAALRDAAYIRKTIEYVRHERQTLFKQLSRFTTLKVYPAGANFLLVEIINGVTAMELKERLIKQRILIRDCGNFKGLSPQFFRIAVRTGEENERLVGCLRDVLK